MYVHCSQSTAICWSSFAEREVFIVGGVVSNCMPERMQNHIGYISPLCAFVKCVDCHFQREVFIVGGVGAGIGFAERLIQSLRDHISRLPTLWDVALIRTCCSCKTHKNVKQAKPPPKDIISDFIGPWLTFSLLPNTYIGASIPPPQKTFEEEKGLRRHRGLVHRGDWMWFEKYHLCCSVAAQWGSSKSIRARKAASKTPCCAVLPRLEQHQRPDCNEAKPSHSQRALTNNTSNRNIKGELENHFWIL